MIDVSERIELKGGEEVLEVVRAVGIVHAHKFFGAVLWLVLPFFFLFPMLRSGAFWTVVLILWILSGIIILSRVYIRWARTLFIVTDRRVVDLDQRGFFHRVVSEARYTHIEEATFAIKGIMPTLLRYGTINLHLKGSAADIEFAHIRKPQRIYNLINDLRSEVE